MQARLCWDLCCEGAETRNRFPWLLAKEGRGEGRGGAVAGQRAVLGGLLTPSVVPCFCSLHLRDSSWFVAFLYLIVHNCPNCTYVQLFLVIVSLYAVAGGDFCPGLSISQPISELISKSACTTGRGCRKQCSIPRIVYLLFKILQ